MSRQIKESQFFSVDGVDIRYSVQNKNKKNILLIFNGIGASIELVEPFVQTLKNTTIIAFDAPGAGDSSVPCFPWRAKHHIKAIAALLDFLQIEKVNALGVSWGGMLAQQFAKDCPKRCEKLILAATSPGIIMFPGKPTVLLKMASPLRYVNPNYMQNIAGKIYGGSLRTNKLGAKRHASLMKPPSYKGYYFQILAMLGWSSLPWLHKLKQPTLVLAGSDDPIVPVANAKVMSRLIPNSELRIVDCGHLFLITRANILGREIELFIES